MTQRGDNMKSPHAGHRQRIRNQFLKVGIENMEQHNILELLLTYVIPQADTNILGHRLIDKFGSISKVFDAPIEELVTVKGIGMRSATLIKLIPQLARVYLEEKHAVDDLIDSCEKAGEHLRYKFIGRDREVVHLLCLDAKGKILFDNIIIQGSIDRVCIEIRTVVETAIRVGATGIVIAHNHPNGFAIPSRGDVEATRRLHSALSTINIRLIDHIIVAKDDYVSLAQSGIITELI